ncbi:AsnC family transcriptional regulator [Azorhizobium oxalatiphilum]|uniref:AsnC family transcriptional regulator n=1 Tax=Azorhizobium oxalatiphilum TaxID=980631 RepID=A0A917BX12_9HYPH|nr:Lrp/AsnC family transcriptional regulator [Azorhizobium oxalatiphilum]GGF61365.1 AsnC family transcriptional regulator [Azorhizobium oxalatiphilum]
MLDDLDRRLLALLRADARRPVAKLATELGVSRATVSARIDRLVRDGVILGFTILTRPAEGEESVQAVTMVEVDGKHAEAVIRRLNGFPEIRALSTTNGRWDLVAEIEAPTLKAFDDLLRAIRQIDGISASETSILLGARKATRPRP